MHWKTWSTRLLLLGLCRLNSACSFMVSLRFERSSSFRRYHQWNAYDPQKRAENENLQKERSFLDLIFNPYESKIPKEIEKDIFAAEANTQAAKDRTQRITLYAVAAFVGVLCAFFNGFLTELRTNPAPDGNLPPPDILDTVGFGWVNSNFLFTFLFTNKIGGFICLLGGGACGLLAEAEYDTRRINAEKIFDEMQRRRIAKESKSAVNKKISADSLRKGIKKRSGKESKRMNALSEVASDARPSSPEKTNATSDEPIGSITEEISPIASKVESDLGVMGKIKEFYSKADSMAATQALLLNKKLEEEGLIEKITDESGLKVIGKEAASMLKEKGNQSPSAKTDAKI